MRISRSTCSSRAPTSGGRLIDRAVEGVGGRANAAISFDYTDFSLLLPSYALEIAVRPLSDMVFRSTFEPEEIDREREVILEEANIEADNPRDRDYPEHVHLVFDDNPNGHPFSVRRRP